MNECCKQIEDSARRQLESIYDEKEAVLKRNTELMKQEKDYQSRLRDEFAMAALTGLLSDSTLDMEYHETVSLAYGYADEAIKVRREIPE